MGCEVSGIQSFYGNIYGRGGKNGMLGESTDIKFLRRAKTAKTALHFLSLDLNVKYYHDHEFLRECCWIYCYK